MYLGELSAMQKSRFPDLGICLAATEDDFFDTEKGAIHLLCDEMRIEDRYTAEVSPDEAIRFLASEADRRTQRIVVFELLGIAMADNVYHHGERELIAKAADAFSIGCDEIKELYVLERREYVLRPGIRTPDSGRRECVLIRTSRKFVRQ